MADRTDIPPFLVLQHAACEPPAAYGEELTARAIGAVTIELDRGDSLPADPGEFAGIVAMGGPMGAYEIEAFAWLAPELALLEEALAAGTPVWGICLGAQLLAAALGARVAPGADPEVGVHPVRLTPEGEADQLFAAAPAAFEALHWHGDTYELPAGATRLAESDAYPQQGFRHGLSYGLQFHLEAPASLVGEWAELPAYETSLEQALGAGAVPGLVRRVAEIEDQATSLGRRLFGGWIERCALPAALPAAPG